MLGPTMSHHFSSVNSQLTITVSIASSVILNKRAQNNFRFNFCAGVKTSVYQGFVQRYIRSVAILWIVESETSKPCRAKLDLIFGAVCFGSLNHSSQSSTMVGCSRFVFFLFSPLRSRKGSRCGVAAARFEAAIVYKKVFCTCKLSIFFWIRLLQKLNMHHQPTGFCRKLSNTKINTMLVT